jgi:hypothetical protein
MERADRQWRAEGFSRGFMLTYSLILLVITVGIAG